MSSDSWFADCELLEHKAKNEGKRDCRKLYFTKSRYEKQTKFKVRLRSIARAYIYDKLENGLADA